MENHTAQYSMLITDRTKQEALIEPLELVRQSVLNRFFKYDIENKIEFNQPYMFQMTYRESSLNPEGFLEENGTWFYVTIHFNKATQ